MQTVPNDTVTGTEPIFCIVSCCLAAVLAASHTKNSKCISYSIVQVVRCVISVGLVVAHSTSRSKLWHNTACLALHRWSTSPGANPVRLLLVSCSSLLLGDAVGHDQPARQFWHACMLLLLSLRDSFFQQSPPNGRRGMPTTEPRGNDRPRLGGRSPPSNDSPWQHQTLPFVSSHKVPNTNIIDLILRCFLFAHLDVFL